MQLMQRGVVRVGIEALAGAVECRGELALLLGRLNPEAVEGRGAGPLAKGVTGQAFGSGSVVFSQSAAYLLERVF